MGVIVIGIDPSLTGLAVAVRAPDGEITVKRFTSKPKGKRVVARLARYYGLWHRVEQHIDNVAKSIAASFDGAIGWKVFLEGYSYNSSGSVIATAEFGGVLRAKLDWLLGADDVDEVPPATLKQFVCKGNASKTVVIGEIVKRYGVTFATDDEYDAYALARLGAVVEGLERPANGKQATAAEKVRKSRDA